MSNETTVAEARLTSKGQVTIPKTVRMLWPRGRRSHGFHRDGKGRFDELPATSRRSPIARSGASTRAPGATPPWLSTVPRPSLHGFD
jgi:hypothetical protein